LPILSYGPGRHIQHLVVALIDFVVEQTNPLVDVVGLELSHHVRFGNRTVDVADHDLFVLTPEEDLEFDLLGLVVS